MPRTGGSWLATAAFVALVGAVILVDSRPTPVMRGLAIIFLGAGVLFTALPFHQLRRYGAAPMGGGYMQTTAVAQRGLYALVRHPQYLGHAFLAWGLAASTPHWFTILPALAVSVGCRAQAHGEERVLLERFGDVYRAYMRTVPRFGLLTGLVRYARRARRARVEAP